MTNHDRRKFIHQSSMLAGGILLQPGMNRFRGKTDYAEGLKIGLVGCGGRGTGAASQALLANTRQSTGGGGGCFYRANRKLY